MQSVAGPLLNSTSSSAIAFALNTFVTGPGSQYVRPAAFSSAVNGLPHSFRSHPSSASGQTASAGAWHGMQQPTVPIKAEPADEVKAEQQAGPHLFSAAMPVKTEMQPASAIQFGFGSKHLTGSKVSFVNQLCMQALTRLV